MCLALAELDLCDSLHSDWPAGPTVAHSHQNDWTNSMDFTSPFLPLRHQKCASLPQSLCESAAKRGIVLPHCLSPICPFDGTCLHMLFASFIG